jgi:putative endonuclease
LESGYTYIICNDRKNVVYIGVTNDLKSRIVHHKRRLVPGFSKRYNVHRLVYYERCADIQAARKRERQIKGYRREKKKALIDSVNPEWKDLHDTLP